MATRETIMNRMSSLFLKNRSALDLSVAILVLLGIWWLISSLINPIRFPSPTMTLDAAWQMTKSGALWADTSITVIRVLVGYVSGVIGGVFIGILIGRMHCIGRY